MLNFLDPITFVTLFSDLTLTGPQIVFCGAIIDPSSYTCRPDFSAYADKNIAYATTFNDLAFVDPYGFILKRMLFLVVLKLQPLYLDESFNGRDRVLSNAFAIHFVSALRLHSMIDSLIFVKGLPLDHQNLDSMIRRCGNKVAKHYMNISRKHAMDNQTVTPIELKYLYLLAIYKMFSKKGGAYGKVTFQKLKKELSRHKVKNYEELNNTADITMKNTCLLRIKSHAYQKII